MENNLSALQKTCCLMINIYQKTLSHVIGQQCRFFPSCSEYTKQAIIIHGTIKGIFLGIIRILKCNPMFPGGFDFVPKKNK